MPPYPRGCHIAGIVTPALATDPVHANHTSQEFAGRVPETGSFHWKARGTLGGVDAPLTPICTFKAAQMLTCLEVPKLTVIARTPAATRAGIAARVVPGTSR